MSYKGIIFDFNGTLYWDSAKHKQAWRLYSKKLRGTEFSDEEMLHHMFGRTNEEIIEYAIGKKPSAEMVEKLGQKKEELYRQMEVAANAWQNDFDLEYWIHKELTAYLDVISGTRMMRDYLNYLF